MSLIALLMTALLAHSAPRTLAFNGVTGDGEACKVRYALDAEFTIANVMVEGRYTENDTDFTSRLTEYYKRLKDSTDPKVYSSKSVEERIDGAVRMNQMEVHILTDGHFGAWVGGLAGPLQNHQRERWEFSTVGKRLAEPTRVIFRYSLSRINHYYVPQTVYTRTIDCQKLTPAKPEREI